jgi:hypothetical protein
MRRLTAAVGDLERSARIINGMRLMVPLSYCSQQTSKKEEL